MLLFIVDRDSVVPYEDDHHDIADVHLLQNGEELAASPVLSIIVEAFSQDFLLLDRILLTDTVSNDLALCRCVLYLILVRVDLREVVDDEPNLIFVAQSRG